ncbi:MAG: flagellar filament capping protein FliD [Lachnospiraceae bacterium]|nr:flagellar filament capping protein FliD [Lachnospiraceae bacterium]
MASISGTTNSLSTTLRGFGGMASGIDRDSIIEQMSQASNIKIQNQKNAITSLTWKQEAFRGVIDQILDLQEKYLSYSATDSVMDANLFAKNIIKANGDEKVSKYVSVSGSSDLLESMSIRGVANLATAANVQSAEKGSGDIVTEMSYSKQPRESKLEGTKLVFGYYSSKDGVFHDSGTFTMPSSYKEGDKTVDIDYTTEDLDKLAGQLNKAIESNKFKLSGDITIQFKASDDGTKLEMNYATVTDNAAGFKVNPDSTEEANKIAERESLVIRSNSSALGALGFDKTLEKPDGSTETLDSSKGYTLSDYNDHIKSTKDSYVHVYDNMAGYLKGQKFTVSYGGQSKQVELITNADAEELKNLEAKKIEEYMAAHAGATEEEAKEAVKDEMNTAFAEKMQEHLNTAFGKGKITVGTKDGKITFANEKGDNSTLTVTGNYTIRKETGLDKMSSTKISLESSIFDNRERLGLEGTYTDDEAGREAFDQYFKDNPFTINGVEIKVTAGMTVNQLLVNINSSDAGVKATYLSTSNKFTLVSKETGSGRGIELSDSAKEIFFNGKDKDGNQTTGTEIDGEDALMYVDYGTGATAVTSSTNTFDMDGLKITVSGEFGIEKDKNGELLDKDGNVLAEGAEPMFDTSKSVTFNASADVDKATETVKKFLEQYNELVKAINKEVTTKPDDAYGPLSDEQKEEMNETSIENWEKKAKQGLLFNNSIMRDLSLDMQGVLTKIMGSGVTYDDLQEIGISMSEDPYDGGTLKFDESKFKAAMKDNPEKVGNIFTGGGGVSKGIGTIINDTTKQYATRYSYMNGGSNGRLVEEAGTEKISLSLQNNTIYNQLKDMQENLTSLRSKLKTEQDRYIQMFTTMEKAISNMNSQSSYLSSITG